MSEPILPTGLYTSSPKVVTFILSTNARECTIETPINPLSVSGDD